ncbi:hypothetical protein AS9A_3367 [Hoyosella subflava DQS3-9A1]|uniref:Uncharacterized protein n=1 Tax=Hoyosella subflava (strain DSM 45089 / JCM 17490 / NBRC 109087 / DQS3-9A1) TaxID=443218 RepID=F6EPY7_HOYSD|nr:hypothetical protein AS9A_3367 [Hoyosella subflava DQS3-9A1]
MDLSTSTSIRRAIQAVKIVGEEVSDCVAAAAGKRTNG